MDQKIYKKCNKNILLKYILVSLITVLTIRYVPKGKLELNEIIIMVSVMTSTMLILDLHLPTIKA